MPNTNQYTENAEKWRVLSDIDYFTQFVKAWIAFNAWYKNNFPTLKSDKEAIRAIKTGDNRFKDKLERLLNGDDNDSKLIKNEISNLHYQLERHQVKNKEHRISFEKIIIEENPKTHETFQRNTLTYEVKRNRNNHKLIELKITDRNGNNKLLLKQNNGYDLAELENDDQYQSLSPIQKKNLKYCYEEINPHKSISLLTHEVDYIQIGSYQFIDDIDKICKGVITALYLLRNSLFHGQIIPDKETNKVYEPAYHILHKLVEEL
ncbi:MAG: hypothetical protein K8S00_13945 [Bacteroidales bacterium]|nr:hypothetical protein [Bacteroidales bacterium]